MLLTKLKERSFKTTLHHLNLADEASFKQVFDESGGALLCIYSKVSQAYSWVELISFLGVMQWILPCTWESMPWLVNRCNRVSMLPRLLRWRIRIPWACHSVSLVMALLVVLVPFAHFFGVAAMLAPVRMEKIIICSLISYLVFPFNHWCLLVGYNFACPWIMLPFNLCHHLAFEAFFLFFIIDCLGFDFFLGRRQST